MPRATSTGASKMRVSSFTSKVIEGAPVVAFHRRKRAKKRNFTRTPMPSMVMVKLHR
jgi:hypothetical protein